jgi:Domain of unknown function (DUF4124)
MNRTVVAICLAIAPLVAFATIYKVRMPDGTILFTDSPPAGAKILEERQPLPTPPARPPAKAPPAPGATTPRAADTAASAPQSGSTATQSIDAAMAEISDAERELAVARRKLETGREPLPGERLGTVSGRSRLSPEYESRIAGLERDVATADARVKRAYDARNALR